MPGNEVKIFRLLVLLDRLECNNSEQRLDLCLELRIGIKQCTKRVHQVLINSRSMTSSGIAFHKHMDLVIDLCAELKHLILVISDATHYHVIFSMYARKNQKININVFLKLRGNSLVTTPHSATCTVNLAEFGDTSSISTDKHVKFDIL